MEKVCLLNNESKEFLVYRSTLLFFDKLIPTGGLYYNAVTLFSNPPWSSKFKLGEWVGNEKKDKRFYEVQKLIKAGVLFDNLDLEMQLMSTNPEASAPDSYDEALLRSYRLKYENRFDITLLNCPFGLFDKPENLKSDVVSSVKSKIPILPKDLDADRVIDFKSDPDTKLKLAALRSWMVDMNKAQYTQAEIEDKFQHLYYQYIDHMDRAKIKYTLEGGEFWITAIEDIVNDLSSMKFGSAAKALFSIGKRHLKLLDEERKAPGKELAFIYKARKEFGG